MVVLLAAVATSAGCAKKPSPPRVLHDAPAFTLTDQTGARFVADQRLAGQAWVANFIFTRCPDICPVFTARMAELQAATAKLPAPPRLVSFSVDPEHDTPERLAAYAQAHGADPARWSFLTGPTDSVRAAVEAGLKIEMGRREGADTSPTIAHGRHFVLVDGARRVRGYYDMEDKDAIARILGDLAGLAGEKPAQRP